MGYETRLSKNFSPIERRSIRLGILAGLLVSLTYFSPSIFYSFPFANENIRTSSMNIAPTSQTTNDSVINSPRPGLKNVIHDSLVKCNGSSSSQGLYENGGAITINGNEMANASDVGKGNANGTQILLGTRADSVAEVTILDALKSAQSDNGNASLSKTSSSTQKETMSNSIQSVAKIDVKPEAIKPLCEFSNRRSDLCDMHGEIRIHGKSSSVVYVTPSRNESWRIKPYARKSDLTAMAGVREIAVRSSNSHDASPQCSVNHSVPAVIFSVAGYTGNYFHDFTDVLVPLFLTSYQFDRKVQFLIANFRLWWINKYRQIFTGLSEYELIDLDNDNRIHCSRHVMLGLNSHDDLRIDTGRSPNGYSMLDFTRFLRTAYSLPRDSPQPRKRPRLLIVARSRTRKFTNLSRIVKMAEKLGFEVVVGEAELNVAHYAQVVNSCDVLMGVHGAGLTNLMFLPTSAVLIQILPWGELEWIAKNYFREPAKGMGLRYLEYRIGLDESTLVEVYSRDDPVLKDPLGSVRKYGWGHVAEIYLRKQDVKLNVKRFRPVLLKALKLLHE